jgi:hypothetical protein
MTSSTITTGYQAINIAPAKKRFLSYATISVKQNPVGLSTSRLSDAQQLQTKKTAECCLFRDIF